MVAQLIVKAALTAVQIGIGMSRVIEGPRQQDLAITQGDYGAPWPWVRGTRWLRPPMIWAKDLTEVKRQRKTKGGKYNEYTYFGSWALGLARHELAGIRRVKLDGHLVLDLSGVGPITPFALTSTSSGGKGDKGGGAAPGTGDFTQYMDFRPGTLTQTVVAAIEADVEAKHGAGFCPAYLGRAILAVHGLPLDKFGNRLPQCEVEVVSVLDAHIPSENFTPSVAVNYRGWRLSADESRLAWQNGASLCMWDVGARAEMASAPLGVSDGTLSRMGLFNNGNVIFAGPGPDLYQATPDGATTLFYNSANGVDGAAVVADGNGIEHWGSYSWSFYTDFVFDGVAHDYGMRPGHYFADTAGNVWVVLFSGTTVRFLRLVTIESAWPVDFSVTMPVSAGTTATVVASAGESKFLLCWEGIMYVVDPATGAYTTGSAVTSTTSYGIDGAFANIRPGARSIWLNQSEYEIDTGLLLRSVSLPSNATRRSIYSAKLHALITNDSGLTIYYLDRLTDPGLQLGDVVRDVCVLAGIPSDQIDVSLLTQVIPGFSATTGSGREWLEPLLDLYDVDPRPHGFLTQFLPRGTAPSGVTITADQMARSDEGRPLFGTIGPGSTDLPRQVVLQFADVATEQQPNAAQAPARFDSDGQRVQVLDMSNLALGADTARQLIGRYDRRQRFNAHGYTFTTAAAQLALEPGDVKRLDLRGVAVTARLDSMQLNADRRLSLEWKRDDPGVAVLDGAAGAVADGHTAATIAYPQLSRGFVLDVPLLVDADASAKPLLEILSAPWSDGGSWPGAIAYQAIDGEYSEELVSVGASDAATWGYASAALPNALATVWDRGSALNVALQVGSLTGCTEAEVEANPRRNLFALRSGSEWELAQFTSVTLELDGSWTLRGLLRGRRGTEHTLAGHAARDIFLLLDSAEQVELGLSEVGMPLSVKLITAGLTEDGAFPIDLTFTGASLKPLAPVNLTALRDVGSGDWALGWTRRTRVGGSWTDGADVPLGEVSELYTVEIMDGPTVKRTVTGLTSPALIYTNAQQTADFGAPLTTAPARRIYQISDAAGRGFAAAA